MTEIVQDIKQWGNNLGVRLPAAIVRQAHLHVHQQVKITVVENQIIITPQPNKSLSLAQRLALFDNNLHGGEA